MTARSEPLVPSLTTLWWVFLGGCAGTGLRAGISVALAEPATGSWWITLGVNVLGALLLGVLMARLRGRPASPGWVQPLVDIGMLGSFTTYSALAIDANRLGREVGAASVVVYPVASLLRGLVAVTVSLRPGRHRRDTDQGPAGDARC